jgi:hypothetical protein
MPQVAYYEYETSPRKVAPRTTNVKKAKPKQSKKEQEEARKKLELQMKKQVVFKATVIIGILFFMIFRNAKLQEKIYQIQTLKLTITELQKETDQLEVAIQNSLNLNTVEQSAKELLGMQKLTVKQSVYIELPKKDYVEPKMQEVIIKEDNSLFTRLSKRIKDLF